MGHDGMSGLLKTSGAATADADRGRGGRVGACGFTTAGTLMFNLRRRNRFRKARLNCSYVSDGDAGDIVRRPVIDSTWRRGSILTCSGHNVTLVGLLPKAYAKQGTQRLCKTETEKEGQRKMVEGQVQLERKEQRKGRERCMLAPRAGATGAAKDVFSIRVSIQ